MANMFQGAWDTITAVPRTIIDLFMIPVNTVGGAISGLFRWAPLGSLMGAIVGGGLGFTKGTQGANAGENVDPISSLVGGAAMGAVTGAGVAMAGGAGGGALMALAGSTGKAVSGVVQTVGSVAPSLTPGPGSAAQGPSRNA